jgi:surface-anchored protein
MNQARLFAPLAAVCAVLASFAASVAAVPVYYAGHSDIGVDYLTSPPRFDLKIRFDGNSQFEDGSVFSFQRVAPDSVAIRAPDPPILRERKVDEQTMEVLYDLTGPEWDFLGVELDKPLWFMPQTNDPARPFFGFATDNLNIPHWSGPMRWSLKAIVSAPAGGNVSLWQTGFGGDPTPKYASYDGIDAADDSFTQSIGGHDHYNWGFSKPGVYKVQLGATATRIGVGTVHGSAVFTFLVGDDAGQLLVGDYNGDGIVDAADYTVWRNQLNQTGGGLTADGDQNGIVDAEDYLLWKSNYGNLAASGASAGPTAAIVPEPTALTLIFTVSLVVAFRFSDRIRR